MVTASDVLRVHRIAHDGQRDRFMTTCPKCSHLRKKKRDCCLSVKITSNAVFSLWLVWRRALCRFWKRQRKHFGSGMPNVAENRLSGIRTFSMTRRCWTKARHLSSRREFDDALVAIQSSYPTTVSVPNSAAVPKTVTGRNDATSQKRWNIVGIIWID
jgi:hypothetical protein